MKISEIYTVIAKGDLLDKDAGYLTMIAIELLARTEGVPLSDLDMRAPAFARAYPHETPHRLAFWHGATHYQAWRRLIMDAQMRAAPGDVDGAPWASLSRAERLQKRGNSAIYNLRKFLPPEALPKDVTNALLANIRKEMPRQIPVQFRAGVNVFRKLFTNDLALRSGLLPDTCPNPFPRTRDHGSTLMSPAIKIWRDNLGKKNAVGALNYVNRLAVLGGVLNGRTDKLDDLRAALSNLPDPERAGLPPIKSTTLSLYKKWVRHALDGPVRRKPRPRLPEPTGVRRTRHRRPPTPQPVPIRNPVKEAWDNLYTHLRNDGWKSERFKSLSYLRKHATAAGIAPKDLSQPFIDTLQRGVTKTPARTQLRSAVRDIATLSQDPALKGLPSLTPPEDLRFTHGGLPPKSRTELEELMDFMNPAPSTRRSFRVAVGVLADAMGRPDLSLKEFLDADVNEIDLGSHEPRRKTHVGHIKNLRAFSELLWTPAWRELQTAVVTTGITASANPVQKVLSWKPGESPKCVNLDWARGLDRDLRSTLTNPPHGRADLAITLARHLAAFDALHDIPEVVSSGNLPRRVGPIR